MRDPRKYYFIVIVIFFLGTLFMSIQNSRKVHTVRLLMKERQSQYLVVKKVCIPRSSSSNDKIFWILKELISGPISNQYERVLDPDIEIQRIVIRKNIAYVSFNWKIIDSLHKNPAFVISSIVNSILMNIREIEGVKILIEDIEPVSTLGNISLGGTFNECLKTVQ
ncbi:MAG: GerMN domain-containing protein [Spirochaetota bacterium]|nr:MAG: GerMN domain-containing protein [Spirochaetota bacterium]